MYPYSLTYALCAVLEDDHAMKSMLCYACYAMLCYAMKWKAILRIEIERQSERESEIAKRNETQTHSTCVPGNSYNDWTPLST